MLVQDIRYALRSFRRAPGFTVVALITLALGIGGTTAIFSIVDGVVLRPLPYNDSARILQLVRVAPNGSRDSFSSADYLDLKKDATTLSAVAAYRSDIVDLTGRSEPVRINGMQTSAGFFDVFDAPPLVGRTYHESTDQPGAAIAVISEAVWKQQFGGNASVIGTQVRLNGTPTEIIGVVPDWVRHPQKSDAWMLAPSDVPTSPFGVDTGNNSRDVHYFSAVGRVAHQHQVADARQQLKAIGDRLAHDFKNNAGTTIEGRPLAASMVADVRTAMLVLLASVGFVLLIACANVGGLLIARGAARRRELAVRTALGAGRSRLIQQLLTESVVLAIVGGALGMIVASWTLQLLITVAPDNLPRLADVTLDWRIALFAFAATIVVGMLFGLLPALQSSRPELNADLKDGGRTGTARTGMRNVMVVAQVALALVLLIGAGLMLTSFSRLRAVDPGFRTTELVTVELMLPLVRYNEAAQRRFYSGVLERLKSNPATANSAMLFPFPFGGGNAQAGLQIVGQPAKPPDQEVTAELYSISPGYLRASGVRLIEGRDFNESDGPNSPPVALISESTRKEFGGKNPIGEKIDMGDPVTVIGVVSDTRRRSLDAPLRAAVYLPYTQFVLPYMGAVVRTDRGAGAVASAVKAAVAQIDPDLPVGDVKTMEQIIDESTGEPRFRSFLIASFAALALLLAAVGVYGLISFTVTQRVPEIGVRLALGASPRQVFSQVIGQGLRLAVVGVVLGLITAAAAATLVRGLLFNTSATDPVVYASLSLLLLAMAGLACYVPARRAMRIDPMRALRSE
ncbi:MAG TPA: ABC transporter permease [Vicinamibacterales bacterium]|nr:ABC transporter permease [Vicinamibacterales bacterium]